MNRDDIISMAQDCGIYLTPTKSTEIWWSDLAMFAELVAAAEREACAKICEEAWNSHQCETAIRARGNK